MISNRTGKTHTETTVTYLPNCDMCAKQAAYDARTVLGVWANLCTGCFSTYGQGLGLGRGQKLILKERGTR